MPNTSTQNKRIAKNTFLLYIRMGFTMVISLYTSRVVLNTLGVEDFGIYNLVGGVIILFSFLSSALNGSIQRFLTFELGRNNLKQFNKVFNVSLLSLSFISFFLLILF
jgi:O-antigen/teichoic acid export membrane protein